MIPDVLPFFLETHLSVTVILSLGEWIPLQICPVHWRLRIYFILSRYLCSAMKLLDRTFLSPVPLLASK